MRDKAKTRRPRIWRPAFAGVVFDTRNLLHGAAELGGVPHYGAILADLTLGDPNIAVAVAVDPWSSRGAGDRLRLLDASICVAPVDPLPTRGGVKIADDVAVAVELLRLALAPNISRVVLVTGDVDLLPAVIAAQEAGKPVTVAAFRGRLSSWLRDAADAWVELDREHVIVDAFAAAVGGAS